MTKTRYDMDDLGRAFKNSFQIDNANFGLEYCKLGSFDDKTVYLLKSVIPLLDDLIELKKRNLGDSEVYGMYKRSLKCMDRETDLTAKEFEDIKSAREDLLDLISFIEGHIGVEDYQWDIDMERIGRLQKFFLCLGSYYNRFIVRHGQILEKTGRMMFWE